MVTAQNHSETQHTGPDLVREKAQPFTTKAPTSEIREDTSQPRKIFRDIEELAESIRGVGLLQALTVRRDPEGRVDYLLVDGARRLRAAKLAGLETVEVNVVDMTDAEAVVAQIVANDQRDDVHPLEQARGYQRWLDLVEAEPGAEEARREVGVHQLARLVGVDASSIYRALKLLELSAEAQDRWLEVGDRLKPAVMIHFARLRPERQVEAINLALDSAGDYELTSRTAGKWLQKNLYLRLAEAAFDPSSRTLTAAGACTTCPKNTAAAERMDLFDEPELAEDAHCTDRKCWREKLDAHFVAVTAAEDAPKVIEAKFDGLGSATAKGAKTETLVEVSQLFETHREGETVVTARDLVREGKLRVEAIARDPKTGAVAEFVDIAAFQAVAAVNTPVAVGVVDRTEEDEDEGEEEAGEPLSAAELDPVVVEARAKREAAIKLLALTEEATAKRARDKPPTLAVILAALSFEDGTAIAGLAPSEAAGEAGPEADTAWADELLAHCNKLEPKAIAEALVRALFSIFGGRHVLLRHYGVDPARLAVELERAQEAKAKEPPPKPKKAIAPPPPKGKGKAAAKPKAPAKKGKVKK